MLTGDTLRRLCRARDALAETGMPVRQVARAAGISPFHFIRTFEALFGVTPHQFRIQSRLDEAKLLLAKGQHSVTEVCMEVGFSSLGSFSDLFTRRTGARAIGFSAPRPSDGAGAGHFAGGTFSGMPEPDGPAAGVGISQFWRSVRPWLLR